MQGRIAFISEHASPLAEPGGIDCGGQNVYIDHLARHLAKLGYYVDIFTRWTDPAKSRIVKCHERVRVVHVRAGEKKYIPKENLFQYMDEFCADMVHFIKKRNLKYKIIHAHFWMSGYVAACIRKLLGIPFVITFHALGKIRRLYQGMADGFPDVRFSTEEMVVREADRIVAECPQDKEDLMIHYYAKEEKIRMIPCGFDNDEFYPMNRKRCAERLGLDPNERIILQLGRMVPRKGIDNVIRATSILLSKHDMPLRLVIVGGEADYACPIETPEIGRLQQIAAQEKILDRVTFAGRKKRSLLRYYYNSAEVFVSTPWYEPFGITPIEAMACGIPVIGTNVGGIKYSVRHDKTGFLVPVNDPEILAERLWEIMRDPSLRRAFGESAIRRANALFTWESVARDVSVLYQDIGAGSDIMLPLPVWQYERDGQYRHLN
jgi:D-inositol-3-phosphate glycosyltransferase